MPVKPSYLLITGAGAIVAYSGLKGKGISSAARQVISGHAIDTAKSVHPITPAVYNAYGYGAAAQDLAQASGTTPAQQTGNPLVEAKNKAIGRTLAMAYGWGFGSNWQSLLSLWTRESGWNQYAYNPSGATGIPQALPWTKMPRAAWLPSQGGSASVVAQIAWGLGYIKTRYGDPDHAWAHEVANNWY